MYVTDPKDSIPGLQVSRSCQIYHMTRKICPTSLFFNCNVVTSPLKRLQSSTTELAMSEHRPIIFSQAIIHNRNQCWRSEVATRGNTSFILLPCFHPEFCLFCDIYHLYGASCVLQHLCIHPAYFLWTTWIILYTFERIRVKLIFTIDLCIFTHQAAS